MKYEKQKGEVLAIVILAIFGILMYLVISHGISEQVKTTNFETECIKEDGKVANVGQWPNNGIVCNINKK